VPTPAGNELPVATATNLIGTLAGRASAEWEAAVPSPETQSFGEALDFASPEVRAAWVIEQLAPPEGVEAFDVESSDEGWIDELYDELEAELLTGQPEAWFDETPYETMEPEWSWAAHG
jgi:hypothetical protein